MRRFVYLLVFGALAVPSSADAKTCVDRSYEDLRARHISCAAAKSVYRTSLRSCSPNNMRGTRCTNPFVKAGSRWYCRAFNSGIYVWRCKAKGLRVVQYRWLAGE